MSQKRVFFFLLLMIFFSSCGYHFGRTNALLDYSTVCVPYVEGDEQGHFTSTLIRVLSAQGCLAYRSNGADLLLKVCLLPPAEKTIGFIFAPEQETADTKVVLSNEARLTSAAQVSLIDRRTRECVFGPLEISTSIDFDYEPDLGDVNEHAFSLGQLEMHNLAQDAAFTPLYTLLAEKIVDYIRNSW